MQVNITRKVYLCGAKEVGKSSLFSSICEHFAVQEPQGTRVAAGNIPMPQGQLPMTVWESQTFERDEFLGVDLFVLLFAIDNPESFRAVVGSYYHAIVHHYPFAQIMLIGTKADLREDEDAIDNDTIRYKDASNAALGMGAKHYMEMDTRSAPQVTQLLDTLARICCGAFSRPRHKHTGDRMQNCNIM